MSALEAKRFAAQIKAEKRRLARRSHDEKGAAAEHKHGKQSGADKHAAVDKSQGSAALPAYLDGKRTLSS